MEITKQQTGDVLDVAVTGRLDAYWADHLSAALDEAVRGGADHIRLNMADVSYMSSVGIRVLLRFYKQLQRINGTFAVSNPSDAVKDVLELAGLQELLAVQAAPVPASVPRAQLSARQVDVHQVSFDVFDVATGAELACKVVGNPEQLDGGRFSAAHCRSVSFPPSAFGVGLGAFGAGFADCEGRFGEFLAAAGTAAYLPTDGTNVPDYLVAAGAFVPAVQVLYALACDGALAHLARFETQPHGGTGRGPVALAELAEACCEIAHADTVGVVMIAESAGLVGAALRRSPALERSEASLFAHPQVREWMSFTPERAYARSVALVVGVAARAAQPVLSPLLRPLHGADGPAGHFHAAAFSYRPLQKGVIDLNPTIVTIFETERLQGVLHLLTDDRDVTGVGQSEFVRGACWTGPITAIVADRG
jgi:anti-anti-sigma factor